MTEGLDEPILVVPKPRNWPILTVRDAMFGNCVTDSFPPQKIALSRISSYLKYKGILTIPETDAVVCRFGDAFHERHQYLHELNACSGDLLDVYPRIWWQLEGKPYQQRLKKKYKLLFAVKMRPGLRDQFGNENWDWSQVAPYERENATGIIPVEGYGYETLVDVLNRSIREGRLNAYWSYRIQYEDQAPFNPDPLLKGAYRAQYLFALDPKPGTIIPVTNEGMQPNY